MKIVYRDSETWEIKATMPYVPGDQQNGILIAQRYVKQFPDLTACVIGDEVETVVSRATEWQKRG